MGKAPLLGFSANRSVSAPIAKMNTSPAIQPSSSGARTSVSPSSHGFYMGNKQGGGV